ncbi:RNA polymerase sigma factor [Xylanibacter brevis]|jgi:RNA polymerase sigma-70 factor (ECF subfamily)|uniref:RNA polymerase sigma factor n=1 Tax=Xylanibacter brevis TaxID=83231 RepID=UPI0005C68272|nr:sigma-70 family RNA polymerase sigma factor [Xylanibacter brevis]
MQQADEQQLIARILDGHAEDYGYFLTRYGQEVFRLVARLVPQQQDAEELVQDAFVRAFNRLDTYTGEAQFQTWLCRIAYNLAVSWLRKQKMKYISIDERPDISDADIDRLLDDNSRVEQLRDACAQLTPDEQTLVNLYYYDEKPIRDIAYILGLEQGNIATRLFRIRKKLYLIIKKTEKL